MKDILSDIVAHTNKLGFLNIVKVTGTEDKTLIDRKSTRLNSSHIQKSRMPSSA